MTMATRRNEVERTLARFPSETFRSSDPSPFSRVADFPGRREAIALVAYYLAERRGFAPGHEVEDWLRAEQEVDARRWMIEP